VDFGSTSSVIVILEVTPEGRTRVVEVDERAGETLAETVDRMAVTLRQVWRVRRAAADATGFGAAPAEYLSRRLRRGVLEPVTMTAERKARLMHKVASALESCRLVLPESGASIAPSAVMALALGLHAAHTEATDA